MQRQTRVNLAAFARLFARVAVRQVRAHRSFEMGPEPIYPAIRRQPKRCDRISAALIDQYCGTLLRILRH
jgi:hypothetical protein